MLDNMFVVLIFAVKPIVVGSLTSLAKWLESIGLIAIINEIYVIKNLSSCSLVSSLYIDLAIDQSGMS